MEARKFLSVEAKKELVNLFAKKAELEREDKRLEQKRLEAYTGQSENRSWIIKGINKDLKSLWNKIGRNNDKIKQVTDEGISIKEHRKLADEVSGFKNLSYQASIGCRDVVSVGFSNVLGQYVKVTYFKFTGFMRSVKGCGSLAYQKCFKDIEILTAEQFKKY